MVKATSGYIAFVWSNMSYSAKEKTIATIPFTAPTTRKTNVVSKYPKIKGIIIEIKPVTKKINKEYKEKYCFLFGLFTLPVNLSKLNLLIQAAIAKYLAQP